MKTFKLRRLSFLLGILMILLGNVIGINAVATGEGGTGDTVGPNDPPDGVLVGYRPETVKIKTGEHLEYWGGWVGVPFSRLVNEYSFVLCCKKTFRAMDGCKGLAVCKE
jgi:hypothetical protein